MGTAAQQMVGWKSKVGVKRGRFPLFHLSAYTHRTLTRPQLKIVQTFSITVKLETNPVILTHLADIPYANYGTALAIVN